MCSRNCHNLLLFPFENTSAKVLLVFTIIIIVAVSPSVAQTCNGIPDTECQALYALYNSTDGDNWEYNTNWLSDEPVDEWYGVTVENGHVSIIDFFEWSSGNMLYGTIPQELGNLANLQNLDLRFNNLYGTIPLELGNLTNLRTLNLRSNELTGTIPQELGNMTNLQDLDLRFNNLYGTIPQELGNLANLQNLWLLNNNLTGAIPPDLGNMTSLQDLDLRLNNLTGSIPPELGNLANLNYLYLAFNSLSGSIPPELGNLANLTRFRLDFNSLSGSIPPELGNLTNLKSLYLAFNSLSGYLPAFLVNPPDEVDLRYNSLHATAPAVHATMENKHEGEFLSTQTLPPENVAAETVATWGSKENRVLVSWDPIAYDDDDGGYQVYYKKASDPDYNFYGITADKSAAEMTVSNLKPGVKYTFKVNTVTWSRSAEGRYPWVGILTQNDLFSPYSETDSAVTGTYSRAFLPNWKQAPGYWTGVVASNFGDSAFNLDLAAYDSAGIFESLAQNPNTTPMGAGLQKSLLGSEFLGTAGHEDLSWIELGADGTNKMGSIFLFGVNDTQMMDGAEAQSAYAKKLYFTRPLDEGFFDGWGPEIQMSIVNPTEEEVTVRCVLRGSNGEAESTHTIVSHGFISGDTEDLIGAGHGIVNGYLEIETTTANSGIIGFSRIEFPGARTALGMNAVQTTASRTFYSAQLAHGMNIVTNLRLVNTSSATRQVTLSAIGDNGTPVADAVTVEIPSSQIYSADLGTLFGLESEGVITTGSLVVDADGNGIIGDIIFADGDTLEYAMSLPLQDRLFTEAVFNHISNLPTVFTGFAFYNPGDETTSVLIEAIGTDGEKVEEKTLILDPGERIARTLDDADMWPTFPTQSGGYIKIQSTQPIAGQQLFGDRSLRYMAAIPPTTRIEGMFD